jgi:RsiW-degrading membrane proteinase PrsW (M82 family)
MLIFSLALAPALALGMFMYFKDKYKREPLQWLALAFVLGCVSILFAFVIELLFNEIFAFDIKENFWLLFIFSFGVVALTEESCKFAFLRMFFYRKKFFSEPINGIIYSVMLSLGFAFAESVLYLLASENIFSTAIVRSLTAVPAHFVFAVFMGHFMGLARFTFARRRTLLVFTGFISAVFVHGLYDFFLLAYWMPLGFNSISFLVLLVGIIISLFLIKKSQKYSPYVRRKKWLKDLEDAKHTSFKEKLAEKKESLKQKFHKKK